MTSGLLNMLTLLLILCLCNGNADSLGQFRVGAGAKRESCNDNHRESRALSHRAYGFAQISPQVVCATPFPHSRRPLKSG